MNYPSIQRRPSREVRVGEVTLGGDAPVRVQSMTNTPTANTPATLAQAQELIGAGAELVRVAVPTENDTAALETLVGELPVPVIADVHFHCDRALEAIDAGVAKIRLNPGNIGDRHQVTKVIRAAKDAGVAIRVGVNEGSVVTRGDKGVKKKELRRPLHELMVEKMAEYLEIFEAEEFDQLVLSAKSHDAFTTVAANRLLAARWDYPLHLGVTHAGTRETGTIRSAAALGALLSDGIGDTIRISFAGDPVHEVTAAIELLQSLRLRERSGAELIACPTCGRLQMDLSEIIAEVTPELATIEAPLTVAIMGCVVNGPGEADGADIALCAGADKAALYVRGELAGTIPAEKAAQAVIDEAKKLAGEASG
jgi:(E)-4-hydroxy-3-methylbut-2-enyl-diphosphate synthase